MAVGISCIIFTTCKIPICTCEIRTIDINIHLNLLFFIFLIFYKNKKYNKNILLPTIKVNWDLYKMNKRSKSVININNFINEEEDVEKNFEFMQYD
jgi:hypothetical protein